MPRDDASDIASNETAIGSTEAAADRSAWARRALVVCLLLVTLALAAAFVMEMLGARDAGFGRQVLPFASLTLIGVTVGLFVLNDKHWLSGLRGQYAGSESARAGSEQERRNRLDALLRVGRMMGARAEPQEVLASIASTCLEHFDCDQASVMLLNQGNNELEVRYAAGHDNHDEVIGTRVKVGRGLVGWVAERNRPLVLGNNADIRRAGDVDERRAPSAAMIVPICVQDRVVGVLNIGTRKPGVVYSESDLWALLVFAENAGVCIRQAEQAEWLQTRIATLESRRAATPPQVGTPKRR